MTNEKFILIKDIFGEELFQSTKTSHKDAFIEAIRKDVNLSNADLSGIDLNGMILEGVNLISANLSNSDLKFVEFHNVDLSCADLRNADFYGAKFSGKTFSCYCGAIINENQAQDLLRALGVMFIGDTYEDYPLG